MKMALKTGLFILLPFLLTSCTHSIADRYRNGEEKKR